MNSPKKILVPVDLSKRSQVGVSYAAMLASGLDASLILATNLNLPEKVALEKFAESEQVSLEEAGASQLSSLGRALAPGVEVQTVLTLNDFPGDGILDLAEEYSVDMIVIASHGRSGMTRWLLGSVAEKVSRGAKVPIVIVPARDV